MGEPTSFTIRELTGASRTLELAGRALPYRPFTLEGGMRADFTWYPGSPVATVQMLGADEKPTTINGMWKDRFIAPIDSFGGPVIPSGVALFNGQQVESADDLVKAVELIRLAGQLLEVTWDSKTRRGVLTRFKQEWDRAEDVKWEMEFTWMSRGEAEQPVTLPLTPGIEDFITQARTLTEKLKNAFIAPFNVVQRWSNRISTALTEIDDAITEMESAAVAVTSAILSPVEAARRTLAGAETIKNSASEIVTAVEDTVAREVNSTVNTVSQTFGDDLVADQFTRALKQQARQIESLAAAQGDTLRAIVEEEDLLAAFVARSPTDLRDVATQFYGTPNEWRRLLQYNGFTSSKIDRGELVLVPKIQTIDRGA